MTAPAARDFHVQQALIDYRRYRKHRSPFDAAHYLREGWARYLADAVVDGQTESIEFATACYRIARSIHRLVRERAAVGEKKWDEMTPREQYWQRGRLAVTR